MGGRLKTENTYLYIIIVYRYHGNDAEFSDQFMEVIEDYKEKPFLSLEILISIYCLTILIPTLISMLML